MMVTVDSQTLAVNNFDDCGLNLRFCFDPRLFDREDFTVEKFINFNRKRATLDQIHSDLRAFLRHLQNSMVELINDDYADFVNLSANLAALKETIDKVSTDVNVAWDGFEESTFSIKETASLINQKSEDIVRNRLHQLAVRNKLLFLTSLNRLVLCLRRRPSDLSQRWYLKLINVLTSIHVWQLRIPEIELHSDSLVAKDVCFCNAKKLLTEDLVTDLRSGCQFIVSILAALKLINEVEYASNIVSHTVVKSSVDLVGSEPIEKLNKVFEQVKKLRTQWMTNLQIHNQFTQDAEYFLDDALMGFILAFLDDNLSSLCLPSDPRVFFQSYMLTYAFVSSVHNVEEHPTFLNGLKDRFNTMLYMKRLATPFKNEMATCFSDLSVKWNQLSHDRLHPFEPSNIVLRAINTLYSENCFLPVISPDLWEFTLKLVEEHNEWIKKCANMESSKKVDEITGVVSVKERWPDLVILVAGANSFYLKLYDFCVTKIFKRFHDMHAEETPFRQFIIEHNILVDEERNKIINKIINELVEKASYELMKVGEIPKQYRWTKKQSPVTPNDYVKQAFEYQTGFEEQATNMEWRTEWVADTMRTMRSRMVDIFLEHASKVLNSVQQTGSSLQRFKRKGLAGSESSDKVMETDEYKIKLQLQLDTNFVKEAAKEFSLPVERLDEFLEAIRKTEA